MEEMEQVINDKSDRNQILEGNLGFLLSYTQVFFFFCSLINLFYQALCMLQYNVAYH